MVFQEKECQLLDDLFAYAVQFLLGLGALLSLAIKRHLERPRRPWAIFMADVSKQAFSALVAHFFNMGFSFVLKNKGQENECKWYFINFVVDNLLGMLLNWIFLRLVEMYAAKYTTRLQSGNYGQEDPVATWGLQVGVWIVIIILVKVLVLFAFIIPLRTPLYIASDVLLHPLDSLPHLELLFVMIFVPMVLNILQFWVQDSFLMHRPEGFQPLASEDEEVDGADDARADPAADATAPPSSQTPSLWERSRSERKAN